MNVYQEAQALMERQFDPNVGGGVDRDKLDKGDFVYPEDRSFPVVKPGDVADAVSSFGRSSHKDDFEGFKKRMIALCKRKGEAFMNALPKEWQKDMMSMESVTPNTRASVLIESFDLTEAQINHENRTVRQRIIVSGKSKNKRHYTEDVLRAAAPLFEGVQTYANHPGKNEHPGRSVRDLTGWITNVEYTENALWGTRHFTRTQAGNDTWAMVEDIVKGNAPPSLLGGSINAIGKGKTSKDNEGDFLEVESIESVFSVDDVTTPAAGGGFVSLVASNGDEMTQQLIAAMEYSEWLESRPEFVDKLKREYKAVRLEDETKMRLAEADETVKTASAALVEAQTELQNVRTEYQSLSQTYEKLSADYQQLSLKMSVIEALEGVALPDVYRTDLLEKLPGMPTHSWQAEIDKELHKLKRSGNAPRVKVTGAGVQVSAQVDMTESLEKAMLPRLNEDIAAWQERTQSLSMR